MRLHVFFSWICYPDGLMAYCVTIVSCLLCAIWCRALTTQTRPVWQCTFSPLFYGRVYPRISARVHSRLCSKGLPLDSCQGLLKAVFKGLTLGSLSGFTLGLKLTHILDQGAVSHVFELDWTLYFINKRISHALKSDSDLEICLHWL